MMMGEKGGGEGKKAFLLIFESALTHWVGMTTANLARYNCAVLTPDPLSRLVVASGAPDPRQSSGAAGAST